MTPYPQSPSGIVFDTNATHNFLVWFEWGFILQLVTLAAMILIGGGAAMENKEIVGCGMFFWVCGLGCGGPAWFITGWVLRYRGAGQICSGDGL